MISQFRLNISNENILFFFSNVNETEILIEKWFIKKIVLKNILLTHKLRKFGYADI